jgi:hypothetical protein
VPPDPIAYASSTPEWTGGRSWDTAARAGLHALGVREQISFNQMDKIERVYQQIEDHVRSLIPTMGFEEALRRGAENAKTRLEMLGLAPKTIRALLGYGIDYHERHLDTLLGREPTKSFVSDKPADLMAKKVEVYTRLSRLTKGDPDYNQALAEWQRLFPGGGDYVGDQ